MYVPVFFSRRLRSSVKLEYVRVLLSLLWVWVVPLARVQCGWPVLVGWRCVSLVGSLRYAVRLESLRLSAYLFPCPCSRAPPFPRPSPVCSHRTETTSFDVEGVVASLSARCSVLAAANPIGGHYNRGKTIAENLKVLVVPHPCPHHFRRKCAMPGENSPNGSCLFVVVGGAGGGCCLRCRGWHFRYR